ncbi:MAG: hypothetical protein OEV00_09840 [Acidobacteriota bacterium]|nr:hypothetical protein [Acidobacteriota bacterium]MDH3785612.1 hypothetical protein [Acidobacteriota bacterium]
MRHLTRVALFLLTMNAALAGVHVQTIAEVDAGSGGIEIDAAGNVFTSDFGPRLGGSEKPGTRVWKITADGEVSVLATLPGGNNGHLVYAKDALYVVDRGGHRVYRMTMKGEFAVFAGSGTKSGDDGTAEAASFCFPNDIDASPDGKTFYVNDVADDTSGGMKLGPTRIRRIQVE